MRRSAPILATASTNRSTGGARRISLSAIRPYCRAGNNRSPSPMREGPPRLARHHVSFRRLRTRPIAEGGALMPVQADFGRGIFQGIATITWRWRMADLDRCPRLRSCSRTGEPDGCGHRDHGHERKRPFPVVTPPSRARLWPCNSSPRGSSTSTPHSTVQNGERHGLPRAVRPLWNGLAAVQLDDENPRS